MSAAEAAGNTVLSCNSDRPLAVSDKVFDAYVKKIKKGRRRKPENQTQKWKVVAALNTRILPLLNGRKDLELVVKVGGKRKPRKKG